MLRWNGNQLYFPLFTVRLLFFVQSCFCGNARTVNELSKITTLTNFYVSSGEYEKHPCSHAVKRMKYK